MQARTPTFPQRIGYQGVCAMPADVLSDDPVDETDSSSLRASASHDGITFVQVYRALDDGEYLARVAASPAQVQNGFTVLLTEMQLYAALPYDARLQGNSPERICTMLHAHAAIVRPLEPHPVEKPVPLHPAATVPLTPLGITINVATHDIYREMVELEIVSTFSFQSGRWLGDVAPHLLPGDMLIRLREAKQQAASRERVEARIPKHLHYVKGWPTVMPTRAETILLSEVRRSVAGMMRIAILYTEPDEILGRYAELMVLNAERHKGKALPMLENVPVQSELWSAYM